MLVAWGAGQQSHLTWRGPSFADGVRLLDTKSSLRCHALLILEDGDGDVIEVAAEEWVHLAIRDRSPRDPPDADCAVNFCPQKKPFRIGTVTRPLRSWWWSQIGQQGRFQNDPRPNFSISFC